MFLFYVASNLRHHLAKYDGTRVLMRPFRFYLNIGANSSTKSRQNLVILRDVYPVHMLCIDQIMEDHGYYLVQRSDGWWCFGKNEIFSPIFLDHKQYSHLDARHYNEFPELADYKEATR